MLSVEVHETKRETTNPQVLQSERQETCITYLEVIVLVQCSSSVHCDETHGGYVHVLIWEEEQIHAAAISHTIPG